MKMLGYNLKLLYSPMKWISCIVLVLALPILMYTPTFYDFTNLSEMFIPLIGAVLFVEIVTVDRSNQTGEILYVTKKGSLIPWASRYAITFLLTIGIITIGLLAFKIKMIVSGEIFREPISNADYIFIVGVATIFLGTISMSFANITGVPYLGYGFAMFFCIFWNVNYEIENVFNLLPFVSNPTGYEAYKIAQICLSGLFLLVNLWLANKSPLYFMDMLNTKVKLSLLSQKWIDRK